MDITSYILGKKSSGGGAGALKYLVVDELPQVGEDNTIYLVPKSTSKTNNYYDEYMYIENEWELIGDTEIDLSNYAQKNEVLTKTNTTAFTPTGDYQPATKKYVDDNAGNVYTIAANKLTTDNTELRNVCQKLVYDYYNGKKSCFIGIDNNWFNTTYNTTSSIVDSGTYGGSIFTLMPTTSSDSGQFNIMSNGQVSTQKIDNSYTTIVAKRKYIFIKTDTTTHEITFFNPSVITSQRMYGSEKFYLATNENYSTPYTPLYNGSPATKKYVDEIATTYSGYDATKTQVLKNINGVLTWVDE